MIYGDRENIQLGFTLAKLLQREFLNLAAVTLNYFVDLNGN